MSKNDDASFEAEVRRIATELWPAHSTRTIGDREYDGIFIGEDIVVVLEATTSGKKQKVEEDVRDIDKAAIRLAGSFSDKIIRGYVVTRDDPTSDQLEAAKVARHCKVQVLSFDRFRCKLIDARSYIDLRNKYRFGSADSNDGYIPLTLLDQDTAESRSSDALVAGLQDGQRYVLLGDFGAGKSMTLKDVWAKLVKSYRDGKSHRFPILLNLRDHQGQRNPAEALERHATNLGFGEKHQLVRSWRAGEAVLLLDGFDEIVSQSWTGRQTKLKQARHDSVALVRAFIKDTPATVGVLLAGRAHYFDTQDELRSALALDGTFNTLHVQEFSEDQVRRFLREKGIMVTVPDWIPARPLFLNYLLSEDSTRNALMGSVDAVPAFGWNSIVDSMCEREAQIEAGLDFRTIRRILERLASYARNSFSGLGPIPQSAIREIFRQVCGQEPDDQSSLLLQRLPGLGVFGDEPESRQFIDEDLVDVLRAGDVIHYVLSPFSESLPNVSAWNAELGLVGLDIAAEMLRDVEPGQFSAALQKACREGDAMLAMDVLQISIIADKAYTAANCEVNGATCSVLDLSEVKIDLSRITMRECIIGTLRMPSDETTILPGIVECVIDQVEGRVSAQDLPSCMKECFIEKYSTGVETTAKIMMVAGLNVPVAVCLTILRKLFLQRGAARKDNALYRGLDGKSQRYVPDVLTALQSEGFAAATKTGENTIWKPVRARTARVRQMLVAPSINTDSLLIKVRALADQ